MMNKRQQKKYEQIKLILAKFEAKIKDGEEYTHSDNQIIVTNKYNIDKKIIANTIKYLKSDNDFWTFDGLMSDRQRSELKKLKKIAESKGGKLISTVYNGCENKLEFEDKLGNRFFMSPSNIRNNKWSGYESGNVYNNSDYHLETLRKIAESKGGKLISTKYTKAHDKLEFEDKLGNRFFMSPSNVRNNRWSGYESGSVYSNPEYHFNILKKIAESKGGKIISTSYKGLKNKLEFQDRLQNKFWSLPNNIKRGKWSPFESANTSEEKCRQCFQFIFNKKFINTWDILKRKGKRYLQLDGYNQELNLAFEYQGEQHYNANAVRCKKLEQKQKIFLKIQENDKIKEKLCKEKNIFLVKIKYFDNLKNDVDFLEHVVMELRKYEIFNKYLDKIDKDNFVIDYNQFPTNQKKLEEIAEIAKNKNGKLISTKYIDCKTKLEFEDNYGVRFFMSPTTLKKGSWSNSEKHFYYLKKVELIAEKMGLKLISKKYISSSALLEFENSEGIKIYKSSNYVITKWNK